MTLEKLDQAILAEVGDHWYKIARLVTRAAARLSPEVNQDSDGYDVVHKRIIELVETGVLDSQGNIDIPRESEIRLPAVPKQPPTRSNSP
ncbi:MAG: hypothetical protein JNN07_00560 [Verrucomicrobiales bacterium]|nr:hypothetical protein [Verrucomicrobiales bacterium]